MRCSSPTWRSVSAAGQRLFADLAGELHVFQRRQVLHQIVELEYKAHVVPAVFGELSLIVGAHLLAVQPDMSFVAGVHTAQHVQHGGFSRARRADDNAEFAFFDVEGDMVGCGDAVFTHLVIFADIVKGNKMLQNGYAPSALVKGQAVR